VATREKLRDVLTKTGPSKSVLIEFRQSDKQPFNFVGSRFAGLTNAESFEAVVGVSNDETISFRIYPHYKGGYINVDKARDGAGLMKKLLNLSDHNFLYWGADDAGDVFAGYTITLESGFPVEAVQVVLYSIASLDAYIGQLAPFVDGESPH
jgi:hypothetical protein